ncbi:MAG: hypothetical protein ABSH41_02325 [Syntrophobacteraceae bacterium]|jgi:hypothetical protein
MIEKRILCHERVRRIGGGFAYIEHRFLRDGFLVNLGHHELLLYVFLVLAADRYGISFYGHDRICSLLRLSVEEYLEARNQLIEKDLLAFDGTFFQILSLPEKPVSSPQLLKTADDMERSDPATIKQILSQSFGRRR